MSHARLLPLRTSSVFHVRMRPLWNVLIWALTTWNMDFLRRTQRTLQVWQCSYTTASPSGGLSSLALALLTNGRYLRVLLWTPMHLRLSFFSTHLPLSMVASILVCTRCLVCILKVNVTDCAVGTLFGYLAAVFSLAVDHSFASFLANPSIFGTS